MRKQFAAGVVALCVPLMSACFNVEHRVKLNRDLSGEAAFAATMNMQPMAMMALSMQREMSGRKSTPADIERERQELLASGKRQGTNRFPAKAMLESMLPAGVRLLDSSVQQEGFSISTRFNFAFDNVSTLAQIQVPPPGELEPLQRKAFEHPFPFDIKDEGGTLLLTMETKNPVAGQKAQTTDMELPLPLQAKLEDAIKDVRIAFRLETPLEVLEHNATKKDGQVLLWEYDRASLQMAQGVRVRLKK